MKAQIMMNVMINSLKEQITYLHFHQINIMENVKKTVRDLHVISLTMMELLTQVFLARRVQWQVKAIGHQTTQILQRVMSPFSSYISRRDISVVSK